MGRSWNDGLLDHWVRGSLGLSHTTIQFSNLPFIHACIIQFHVSVVAGGGAGETKTHDRCQPWVFVKVSRSTNADGIAGYDDHQNDSLRDVDQHCGSNVIQIRGWVKREFGLNRGLGRRRDEAFLNWAVVRAGFSPLQRLFARPR
jgi:hypothetical protein